MLQSYNKIGTGIISTMHFLDSHLEFFPENNGDFGDEHLEERFPKDFKLFEERYQGNVSSAMMADFCWSLRRDTDKDLSRKAKMPSTFLNIRF